MRCMLQSHPSYDPLSNPVSPIKPDIQDFNIAPPETSLLPHMSSGMGYTMLSVPGIQGLCLWLTVFLD